jgi:serine/threonine protein kinase
MLPHPARPQVPEQHSEHGVYHALMSDQRPPDERPTESIPLRDDRGDLPTVPPPASVPPRGSGENPGDSIGPYRLLDVIGEGGFGVVWLAERREPMVQRVAVKIIKPGMDSRSVIARFEQERQALAVMDHPNIARVLDGGVTPSGRPYFVMELVEGEPVTAFADRRKFTLRQRLELFIPVCEAVQHAHHKGLIHRDIKPSNVLVTEIGGRPVLKVIDFGIAKAIADKGWVNTAHTQSGHVIGTPEYMSPEQIAGEIDVDTRADVYSLGVLLYELLTGELPFDSREFRKAALAEIQRIIREVTPPKPSTRLMQLAGERTTTIAESRSASRERLTSELRRELDWIPLMALRKERERRYPSPQALADDVQRYLDGRPLRAAPESRAYLARKFVRRNRVQVFAAAAVLVALVAGLWVSLWQRGEAIAAQEAEAKQRVEAERQAEEARQQAQIAKAVTAFVSEDLLLAATPDDLGISVSMRDVLDNAAEKVSTRFGREPLAQAAIRRSIGTAYARLGMVPQAGEQLTESYRIFEESLGDSRAETEGAGLDLVEVLWRLDRFEQARDLAERIWAERRQRLDEKHPDTLYAMNIVAGANKYSGNVARSFELYTRCYELRGAVLGADHPDTINTLHNLALCHLRRGQLAQSQGDLEEAYAEFDRGIDCVWGAYTSRLAALGPDSRDTLLSASELASLMRRRGLIEQAEPLYIDTLARMTRVLGERNWRTLELQANLAIMEMNMERWESAESHLSQVVPGYRHARGLLHPDTLTLARYWGETLVRLGRVREAEDVMCASIEAALGSAGSDQTLARVRADAKAVIPAESR